MEPNLGILAQAPPQTETPQPPIGEDFTPSQDYTVPEPAKQNMDQVIPHPSFEKTRILFQRFQAQNDLTQNEFESLKNGLDFFGKQKEKNKSQKPFDPSTPLKDRTTSILQNVGDIIIPHKIGVGILKGIADIPANVAQSVLGVADLMLLATGINVIKNEDGSYAFSVSSRSEASLPRPTENLNPFPRPPESTTFTESFSRTLSNYAVGYKVGSAAIPTQKILPLIERFSERIAISSPRVQSFVKNTLIGAKNTIATSFLATDINNKTLGGVAVDYGIVDYIIPTGTAEEKAVLTDWLTVSKDETVLDAKVQAVIQDLLPDAAVIRTLKALKQLKDTKFALALMKKVGGAMNSISPDTATVHKTLGGILKIEGMKGNQDLGLPRVMKREGTMRENKVPQNKSKEEITPLTQEEIIRQEKEALAEKAKNSPQHSSEYQLFIKAESLMKQSSLSKEDALTIQEGLLRLNQGTTYFHGGELNSIQLTYDAKLNPILQKGVKQKGGFSNKKQLPEETRDLLFSDQIDKANQLDFNNLDANIENLTAVFQNNLTGLVNPTLINEGTHAIRTATLLQNAVNVAFRDENLIFEKLLSLVPRGETGAYLFRNLSNPDLNSLNEAFQSISRLDLAHSNFKTATGRLLQSGDVRSLEENIVRAKEIADATFSTSPQTLIANDIRKSTPTQSSSLQTGEILPEDKEKIVFVLDSFTQKNAIDRILGLDQGQNKLELMKREIAKNGIGHTSIEALVRLNQSGMISSLSTVLGNLKNGVFNYARFNAETLLASMFDNGIQKNEAALRLAQIPIMMKESLLAGKQTFLTGKMKYGSSVRYENFKGIADLQSDWSNADTFLKKGMYWLNVGADLGYRAMMTADEFLSFQFEAGGRLALAHREARKITTNPNYNLEAGTFDEIFTKLYHGTTDEVLVPHFNLINHEIIQQREQLLFTRPLPESSIEKKLSEVRNKKNGLGYLLRFTVPFYNTRVDMLRQGIENTPLLGMVTNTYKEATQKILKEVDGVVVETKYYVNPEAAGLAHAKQAVGAAVYGGAIALMMTDHLQMTGSFPRGKESSAAVDQGFAPYGIVGEGDTTLSLRNLAPFDFVMKMAKMNVDSFNYLHQIIREGGLTAEEAQAQLDLADENGVLMNSYISNLSQFQMKDIATKIFSVETGTNIARGIGDLASTSPLPGVVDTAKTLAGSGYGMRRTTENLVLSLNPLHTYASGARRDLQRFAAPQSKDVKSNSFIEQVYNKFRTGGVWGNLEMNDRVNIVGERIVDILKEDWKKNGAVQSLLDAKSLDEALSGSMFVIKTKSSNKIMKKLEHLRVNYNNPSTYNSVSWTLRGNQYGLPNQIIKIPLTQEMKKKKTKIVTTQVKKELALRYSQKWFLNQPEEKQRTDSEAIIRQIVKKANRILIQETPDLRDAINKAQVKFSTKPPESETPLR